MNTIFVLIMAGGGGTRFWPASTPHKPKQMLDLTGSGKSLIRMSFDRASKITSKNNIIISTGKNLLREIKRHIPEASNLLLEPVGKNTAPCICWAAMRAQSTDRNATMVVLPSDHMIEREGRFIKTIQSAIKRAQKTGAIITIGIKPTYPHTGYGYIEAVTTNKKTRFLKVKRFIEKPDRKRALIYHKKSNYFWNAGIFIFNLKTILDEIREKLPHIYRICRQINDNFIKEGVAGENRAAEKLFPLIKPISIDYGVMEKAKSIEVRPATFGWSDLGSWSAVYEKLRKDKNKNAVMGGPDYIIIEGERCLLFARERKKVAVIGLKNIAIIDSDEGLLVCSMEHDQNVRQVTKRFYK